MRHNPRYCSYPLSYILLAAPALSTLFTPTKPATFVKGVEILHLNRDLANKYIATSSQCRGGHALW